MKIDRQLFEEVFAGMQKKFIVSALDFELSSNPNGFYDIKAMVEGKIRPPRQAIQFDVKCGVYEKPWKVSADDRILSRFYTLSVCPPDGSNSAEIIKLLNVNYEQLKADFREGI